LLDANTGAGTTEGLQAELVFGGADNVRGGTNAAKRSVINKRGGSQRSRRNSHFLNNGTNNVRDVRERTAIDSVNIGGLTGQNLCDLTNDAVYILGGKVLNRSQGDTFLSHFDLVGFLEAISTNFGSDNHKGERCLRADTIRELGLGHFPARWKSCLRPD
jgi:hypothetical protein